MTIERRTQVSGAILVLSILGVVLLIFWSSRQVENGIRVTESISEVLRSANMLSSLLNEYQDHGTSRALEQWHRNSEYLAQIVTNMDSDYRTIDPELQRTLRNNLEAITSLSREMPRMVSPKSSGAESHHEGAKGMLSSLMFLRLEQLERAAYDLKESAQSKTLETRYVVEKIILWAGISLLLILVINIYLIRNTVVRPLAALSAGAERIGTGDFDYVAEVKSDDEVGTLAKAFNIMVEGIHERTHEREMTIEFLQLVNESHGTAELIRKTTTFFQQRSGCEAIGIRLHEGDDYPYYEARGFPAEFVALENHLCNYDENKCVRRDSDGNPILECMCGNVIRGRFDPSKEFFTGKGSFWSNCTTDLLASSTEEDRQSRTRNRCNGEGYESVALIPLRTGDERWGLLQLNDRSEGRFTPDSIDLWERLAQYLSVALAKCKAEEYLKEAKDHLEIRVQERTSELVEAKAAIMAERQRLYDILETMPVMVCLLTPDHHVAFANRAFRERFGEDNGRHCFDYCFGNEEPCEFCESYRVLETGEPHHWEVTGPDGSVISAYDFPFTNADGSPLILEVDIDITIQRRVEEAVRAERQRLYDVLETLPVYVCLLDADYRMRFANRYFREAFGESQGRRCHDFLFNRTQPCEICETYTVMKTKAPHHWYWKGPNGRDYDIYDFPFTDNDGSMLILEMGIDITERKQAENALKLTLADLTRSNQDLQQFAYVASHDLQEPLRNVASCLQLLVKKYKNNLDANAYKLIDYAVESSARMKSLIQELLAYSRIATREKPLERIDCAELLDRTLKNLSSAISEAGEVITHDPLPTILADNSQLLQVFQNLIQNAIKFRRDESPRVHVSAVKNKNEWIFSVQDNGVGIESQHLERIFVIFQRLHKRGQYDGTGMGLAIVKKVVERHGGRVWAESELGVGTTFYFTIPEKGTQI